MHYVISLLWIRVIYLDSDNQTTGVLNFPTSTVTGCGVWTAKQDRWPTLNASHSRGVPVTNGTIKEE